MVVIPNWEVEVEVGDGGKGVGSGIVRGFYGNKLEGA
jgi:hypothetical protein